jgi:hypothetical protein
MLSFDHDLLNRPGSLRRAAGGRRLLRWRTDGCREERTPNEHARSAM